MDEVLLKIYGNLTPILLGVCAYFLKNLHQGVQDKFDDLKDAQEKTSVDFHAKINDLKEEIHNIKNSLPLHYVLREDYIRFTAGINNKLDKVLECTQTGNNSSLGSKLDKMIDIMQKGGK